MPIITPVIASLASCVADKKYHRPALRNVKLSKNVAIATDGYKCITITQNTKQENDTASDMLIPASDLSRIGKLIKKQTATLTKTTATLTDGSSLPVTTLPCDNVDAYPNIESVYAKLPPAIASITLDPRLLADILEVATSLQNSGMNTITLSLHGGNSPVKIEATGESGGIPHTISALLMPVRA